MTVYLETARLTLRRFTPADADNLVELDSDPAVMRYLTGGTPTPREAIEREILPRFMRSYDRHPGFGTWAAIEKMDENINEKASGAFVGWFGFQQTDDGDAHEVHLGYRLRRAFWGRGLATASARALIRKGFTELGVARVVATTYQDNLASRRVMEKAGLRFVRAYRITQEELAATGTFSAQGLELWDGDDVEYALLKADWERQEAGA